MTCLRNAEAVSEFATSTVHFSDGNGAPSNPAPSNCERALSLDLLNSIELPENEYWIKLGRWLADTPPPLAQGLSAGSYQICVAGCYDDCESVSFQAQLVRLYLECHLPANIDCQLSNDGKPGRLLVEIRRAA